MVLTIKQKKSIDKSLTTIGKKAPSRNTSIQSVSSDVFNDSTETVDEDFETPKKTAKRHLSAKSDGQEASKKNPMFVTTNRFSLLTTDNQSDPTTSSSQTPFNTANCEDAPSKTNLNYEDALSRSNLPPPIIVRGVLDFIGFRDELVRLIGSAEINKDIFNLTSLLRTRVKIEELHKRKDIVQCLNCQEYGHSRKYCAYPPRCVRYGEHHPSTSCVKTRDTPATCALCKGHHPANYKGGQIYKQIQQLQSSSKRRGTNLENTPYINKLNNMNCKITQQPTSVANLSSLPLRSYAQATNNQSLHTPPADQTNDLALNNFINEFKALINPLLSLLTTVLDRLLSQNVK